MTNASDIDLSSCDREPIRTPGSIQPHGFVLALAADGTVVQASDNLAAHLGKAPEAVLGRTLVEAIGAQAAAQLQPELGSDQVRERPGFAATVRLSDAAGSSF